MKLPDDMVFAEVSGSLIGLSGSLLSARMPSARSGDEVRIEKKSGGWLLAEVSGFSDGVTYLAPLGDAHGLGNGDRVINTCRPGRSPVGEGLLGRVLGPLGEPLDNRGELGDCVWRAIRPVLIPDVSKPLIDTPMMTGIRAIDGLVTVGAGQKVGVFSGPGKGKTTILRQAACMSEVDRTVVCLVGERAREINEFIVEIEKAGVKDRTVFFVAPGQSSPGLKMRTCLCAMTAAEEMRERGMHVLLVLDSLTRLARALRDLGISAGEPSVRRAYPPSVFSEIQRLIERAGPGVKGALTAMVSILMEGNEFSDDPVADEVTALLDGHIVLSGSLAEAGVYPSIDLGASLSRVMDRITDKNHMQAAIRVRKLMAAYERNRDLISIGAYKPGADAGTDEAIQRISEIRDFISQPEGMIVKFNQTVEDLKNRFGTEIH